jgi:hypothetical protein
MSPIQEMAGYGQYTKTGEQLDREILYSAEDLIKKGGLAMMSPTAGRNSDGVLETGQVMSLLENGKWVAYTDVAEVDEAVTLTEGGTAVSAGYFTVTVNGETTGHVAWNATAADLQTALEALPSIGAGNVVVTGGPIHVAPFVITYEGDFEGVNVPATTVTVTGLTGLITVSTVQGTATGGTAGGILANGVNVALADQAINIYFSGWFKTDMLIGLDANAKTDLKVSQNATYNWTHVNP